MVIVVHQNERSEIGDRILPLIKQGTLASYIGKGCPPRLVLLHYYCPGNYSNIYGEEEDKEEDDGEEEEEQDGRRVRAEFTLPCLGIKAGVVQRDLGRCGAQ